MKNNTQNRPPVVQRLDNAIHRINRYPADKSEQNKPRYLLDSDLSGGYRYQAFEQPGPGLILLRILGKQRRKRGQREARPAEAKLNSLSPLFA